MSSLWQRLRDRALDAYRGATRGQRLAAMAAAALCVGALVLAAVLAGRTQWAVLYPRLDPEDAHAVTQALEGQGIEYQLSEGGRILVGEAEVPRVHMLLAGQGLPSSGGPGYELFDENDLSLTQDAFGVRMERAKMGHLRAAIETLEPVRRAFVSVNLPRRSAYALRQKEQPSAGITLTLAPGARLSDTQISAMVHLVVGHVGHGITEQDVRITDEQLALLWPQEDGAGSGGRHRRLIEEEEARLERKAMSLLAETLGPGKASLRVSLELDTTYRETQKETRSPTNRVTVRETLSTRGSAPDSEDEDTTTENLAGVEHSLHIQNQPKVERLSAALLLDSQDPAVAANEAALGDLVKAALGYDLRRGDSFTSTLVAFQDEVAPVPVEPGRLELLRPWLAPAGEALSIALVLFIVWRVLRPSRRRPSKEDKVPDVLELDMLAGADPRQRLNQFVLARPDEAREELLHWLGEERRR